MAAASTVVRFLYSTSSSLRRRPTHFLRFSSPLLPKPLFCSVAREVVPDAAWPEWHEFLDKLRSRGYFDKVGAAETEEEGGGAGEEYGKMKAACLAFARQRPDILRSLSRKDIQAVVGCGCPNLLRKSVNSAKRLREYVNLEERHVCGTCNLRGSCDRAYVLAKKDGGARTVDILRVLLHYAVQVRPEMSGDSQLQDSVKESACRLLLELTTLCDTEPDPALLKVVEKQREGMPPEAPRVQQDRILQKVEMKKGDWICTQCEFMNFARNKECRRCQESRPKTVLGPGEWECPSCDFLNFARNVKCKRCSCDRPKDVSSHFGHDVWRPPKLSSKASRILD